jgi:hypothetical protein
MVLPYQTLNYRFFTLRSLESAVIETNLGEAILSFVLRFADNIVDGVIDESLLPLACLDTVQSHFDMRNGLSSIIFFGSFVQLL